MMDQVNALSVTVGLHYVIVQSSTTWIHLPLHLLLLLVRPAAAVMLAMRDAKQTVLKEAQITPSTNDHSIVMCKANDQQG